MTSSPSLLTPQEEAAFRAEVEAFAREHCPPQVRAAVAANAKLHRAEYSAWQKALHRRGWSAPGWPVEYGGTGWDQKKRYVFEEVTAALDCPPQYHHGIGHIGPVLMAFGSDEQKARYLPGILNGEDWWCQGYSEPGAGSDLASLKTQAVRDGEDYIVDGQKIWTSHAQEADLMYTLVRTDASGRKQQGITLLLIPLDTPGITRRAIQTIDGWHHVNEIFLDKVRVPVAQRVGEEGQAWSYAKYLLDRERVGASAIPQLTQLLRSAQRAVRAHVDAARLPRGRHALEERLLLAEAALIGVRELAVKAIDDARHGRPLGSRPSALKLRCSELSQEIVAIGMDAAGPALASSFRDPEQQGGAEWLGDANWLHNYLFYRSKTIAGGTSEVLRNVIAREIFGA
ncbi:acyl-CoA dehydrogenase [Xylophilus rhododendri]|uniref:Acyl-CoA dehydrogenase n=2 Tax=Xylophilus rhododendri TaxID=2697032 RepID=A0A857JCE5_9BURK|nr:acyl-CoA dehydrogenase [Xylophilus rhododendri]